MRIVATLDEREIGQVFGHTVGPQLRPDHRLVACASRQARQKDGLGPVREEPHVVLDAIMRFVRPHVDVPDRVVDRAGRANGTQHRAVAKHGHDRADHFIGGGAVGGEGGRGGRRGSRRGRSGDRRRRDHRDGLPCTPARAGHEQPHDRCELERTFHTGNLMRTGVEGCRHGPERDVIEAALTGMEQPMCSCEAWAGGTAPCR